MSARMFNSALYQKLRVIDRCDRGLCARCPNRAAEDRNLCRACLEKDSARHRTGAPRGTKRRAHCDRWAEMFRGGMTPSQIARAEGVVAQQVRSALKVRKLWPVVTVKP